MAVPIIMSRVRVPAAAKTLRASPPPALPLVIQAAEMPLLSRSSTVARAALLSAAVTATPILCWAMSSPLNFQCI